MGDFEPPEIAERYRGYRRAHEDARLKPILKLCRKTPFIQSTTLAVVKRLVQSGTRFDGIFAASDLSAMASINA